MPLDDMIRTPEGRQIIAQLSKTYGLDPRQAATALTALGDEIVAGLERNTLSRGGIADLLAALASGGHDKYLDDPNVFANPDVAADGTKILGHVLGSEAKANRVVRAVSAETGIGGAILQQILPVLASLILGWLSRGGKGALEDILRRLPGGGNMPPAPGGGGMNFPGGSGDGGGMSWPSGGGDTGGGVGWPSGPDQGGGSGWPTGGQQSDGGSGGGLGFPAPRGGRTGGSGGGGMGFPSGPGDNPYGDLSDVLRRGGSGTGGLAKSIRDILGGLVGFRSNGWISWIIKLVLLRYGWRILGFVVRKVFGR